MSYFPSRHLKTQKKLDRLKKQHTESLRSQTAERQIFNETIISEFLPSNKSIPQKEQDNFEDNHIFASRSHIRSLTSNKSNPTIQKRRQKFFMAVCSVRDIKQPLKTDIIKTSYNTPLKKRKSLKQHFPLNCQNIKFGLPQRVKIDGNDLTGQRTVQWKCFIENYLSNSRKCKLGVALFLQLRHGEQQKPSMIKEKLLLERSNPQRKKQQLDHVDICQQTANKYPHRTLQRTMQKQTEIDKHLRYLLGSLMLFESYLNKLIN